MIYDWHFVLGTIAGIIAVASIIPYVRDILYGTTRPNIVSYSLWALLVFISMLAQINSGASWSIILIVGDFISSISVVFLCLIGYGYSKYGKVELVCTILAVIAIVSWQVTSQPVLAICFAILADAMAAIPTIIKTYHDPWSELPSPWLAISFASALAIISSTIFDFANILFPAYLLLVNGLTGVLALFGRRLKPKPTL